MKPKPSVDIDRLEAEVLKFNLPEVKPIPELAFRDEKSLLKALPYYALRYGHNLKTLAEVKMDIKWKVALKVLGFLLEYLGRHLKVNYET